tara:strand:+ start:9996 stop:11216 length:1221 start_codon:yes stop_codon:yes gene_type:complete
MSLQKFRTDRSGNVAIIFALTITAIISMLGLAIDFQRSVSAEQNVQSALDNSTLAAVRLMQDASKTPAEIKTYAETMFAQNIKGANANLNCPTPTVTVDVKAGKARADVSCHLPTTLASLFSIQQVKVTQTSTSSVNITNLDLAMMLDVSGSMSGQKIKDLQDAAKNAIDILITPQTGDRVRIAFNTYSTAINVGDYAKDVKGSNYDKDSSTKHCVTERDGTAKFRDDAPAWGKYMEEEKKSTDDKSLSCPSSSLEPLTHKASHLKTEIGKLSANGWTAGHLGIAWAWYLISPDWDKIWPKDSKPLAYDEPKAVKAVILMTDGEFNTHYQTGQGNSVSQSKKLCENMRKEGVIVYSVAFKAPKSGRQVLKKCASSSDHYFDAKNGAQLKQAYADIASQLTNLRITN